MKRYYYDYEFETGKHYTGAHEIMLRSRPCVRQ